MTDHRVLYKHIYTNKYNILLPNTDPNFNKKFPSPSVFNFYHFGLFREVWTSFPWLLVLCLQIKDQY